jgi:hypothetical protein
MKTKEEIEKIEQLAKEEIERYRQSASSIDKPREIQRFNGFIKGYTQCQEDMADKIFTLDDVNKIINLAYVSGGGNDTYQECIDFVYEQMNINSLNKQD